MVSDDEMMLREEQEANKLSDQLSVLLKRLYYDEGNNLPCSRVLPILIGELEKLLMDDEGKEFDRGLTDLTHKWLQEMLYRVHAARERENV